MKKLLSFVAFNDKIFIYFLKITMSNNLNLGCFIHVYLLDCRIALSLSIELTAINPFTTSKHVKTPITFNSSVVLLIQNRQ